MKNLILIGMMGCGKTTAGKLLAARLGLELVDTDALIEEREGRAIRDIFAENGEEYFRRLELNVSKELGLRQDLVISCGGGLPLREACMSALKLSGLVFWLDRDPGETFDSLDTSGRPLAQQGREDFLARYEQRVPVYRAAADYYIPNRGTPEDVEALISTIYLEDRSQSVML